MSNCPLTLLMFSLAAFCSEKCSPLAIYAYRGSVEWARTGQSHKQQKVKKYSEIIRKMLLIFFFNRNTMHNQTIKYEENESHQNDLTTVLCTRIEQWCPTKKILFINK